MPRFQFSRSYTRAPYANSETPLSAAAIGIVGLLLHIIIYLLVTNVVMHNLISFRYLFFVIEQPMRTYSYHVLQYVVHYRKHVLSILVYYVICFLLQIVFSVPAMKKRRNQ